MKLLLPNGVDPSNRDALKPAPTRSTSPGGDPIGEILRKYKTIAVVGLSSNPMRPSHGVAIYMQGAGYRIFPVNPNEREVLGEKSYARVEDVPEKVEIVDIFRRPTEVLPAVDGAIRAGAEVVWMQLGVVNDEAGEKARAAGLIVVMDACILVEHKKRRQSLSA